MCLSLNPFFYVNNSFSCVICSLIVVYNFLFSYNCYLYCYSKFFDEDLFRLSII